MGILWSGVLLAYGAFGRLSNLGAALLLTAGVSLAEPVTVVALGDSLTHGYGLQVEKGFVPQLQAYLTAEGRDVVVVNAGVSGDTTAGGRARLDWSLTPEVDALIVELGGNDLLRGIDPAVSRANLEAILQAAQARGLPVLLIGLRASGNYGPEYKAAFDAMYPELASRYGAQLIENFFQPLGAGGGEPGVSGQWMQSDGIHPNAAGVARVVAAFGPDVLALLDRVAGGS